MDRRRIGLGWTLAVLALLGHVVGADCCLIRDAARAALAATAPSAAHACCSGGAGVPADSPAPGHGAPLPDCCGITCAPVAALESAVVLVAPTTSLVAVPATADPAPPVPMMRVARSTAGGLGPPVAPGPHPSRGRAPPIA